MTPLERLKASVAKDFETGERYYQGAVYAVINKAYEIGLNDIKGEYTPCPLTNSSHEKALVRVVEKRIRKTFTMEGTYHEVYKDTNKDFIQALCLCGHIISEAEIKSK